MVDIKRWIPTVWFGDVVIYGEWWIRTVHPGGAVTYRNAEYPFYALAGAWLSPHPAMTARGMMNVRFHEIGIN